MSFIGHYQEVLSSLVSIYDYTLLFPYNASSYIQLYRVWNINRRYIDMMQKYLQNLI